MLFSWCRENDNLELKFIFNIFTMTNIIEEINLKLKEKLIDPSDGRPNHCIFYDICTNWDEKCNEAYSNNICDDLQWIFSFVEAYDKSNSIDYINFTKQYIIQLYILIERVFVVLKILDIKDNQKFASFYRKNFSSFWIIHKRANFLKHPNYFVFCHNIVYWIDWWSEPETPCWSDSTIIDDSFVQNYYSSDCSKKDSELKEKLKANLCVKVKLPNIVSLTDLFCDEFLYFFKDLISQNPFFIDIIKDHSFLEDYFEKLSCDSEIVI